MLQGCLQQCCSGSFSLQFNAWIGKQAAHPSSSHYAALSAAPQSIATCSLCKKCNQNHNPSCNSSLSLRIAIEWSIWDINKFIISYLLPCDTFLQYTFACISRNRSVPLYWSTNYCFSSIPVTWLDAPILHCFTIFISTFVGQ